MNPQLSQCIDAVSNAYRLGMEASAGERLITLMDLVAEELAALSTEQQAALNQRLTQCMEAIARKDYLYAADLLEFEIAAHLT